VIIRAGGECRTFTVAQAKTVGDCGLRIAPCVVPTTTTTTTTIIIAPRRSLSHFLLPLPDTLYRCPSSKCIWQSETFGHFGLRMQDIVRRSTALCSLVRNSTRNLLPSLLLSTSFLVLHSLAWGPDSTR
jgi:hypothetical protein